MTVCLLVRTRDKRKFLIHEKSMPTLIEFVKTFHAEVYRVELIEGKIIAQLKSLASAICNPDYRPTIKVRKLEKLYPPHRPRTHLLENAKKIRTYILKTLSSGKPVSLKQLKKRYKNCKVTDACLCNHLSIVRRQMLRSGKVVAKIGQGKYCLAN